MCIRDSFYAMWLRRYMVDESNKDYVKLARAKGVSESNIALHHVFRNAMVDVYKRQVPNICCCFYPVGSSCS